MDIENIENILTEKVRPALARDGGDIEIVNFDDETGELTVKYLGACAGCPASSETTKNIVEQEVMAGLHGVKRVTVDTSVSNDLIDMAKKILAHEA